VAAPPAVAAPPVDSAVAPPVSIAVESEQMESRPEQPAVVLPVDLRIAKEPGEELEETGGRAFRLKERPLKPFGQNFFASTRRGFSGADSASAVIPARYVLASGDVLTLSYWAKTLDLQSVPLTLDAEGEVAVPKIGKIVARGMTLDLFQESLKTALRRVTVNDLELIVTLDRLKSIQIFVTGEVARPGSHAVASVTTLFNALHAGGGPTSAGSLRDIRLLRGQQTIRVDFYDYLLQGDSQNDLPLFAGDTIFIPPSMRQVGLRGEVDRPAIYELKNGENLAELLALAGGIKSTGILNRVQIRSVQPHQENHLREIDLSADRGVPDLSLNDGDEVVVFPILPDILNQVHLEGSVERPGPYELKKEMRVADLFSNVNHLLGEALMERADLIRLNPDKKTTTLHSIHLGRALQKEAPHNLLLHPLDHVIVYSKFEVAFHPRRVVSIFGAVARPGSYARSDEMRLSDVILMAGGIQPGYHEVAEIARARAVGEIDLVEVDLLALLAGDQKQNLPIRDEDIVSIRKKPEFFDKPIFVTLSGEVKYPGVYALKSRKDRISQLVARAGGPTDIAYLKGSVFTRKKRSSFSPEQEVDIALANRIINMMNQLDFERQRARNQYLLEKERERSAPGSSSGLPVSVKEGESIEKALALSQVPGALVSGTQAGSELGGAIVALAEQGGGVVSRPRQFDQTEMEPSQRVIVSVMDALNHPGEASDLVLESGDALNVPTPPATVMIVGAVTRPTVIVHDRERKPKEYVQLSGGYTSDADPAKVMISRSNGMLLPLNEVDDIEAGDIVFVPPKVVTLEILTTTDKIIEMAKFTVATLASVGIFIALIGLL
jgi:protein involved in polysaccharide export with SLBB domain